MRYDANDSQSNDSDMSSDSQSSQMSSGTDFLGSLNHNRMNTSTVSRYFVILVQLFDDIS